MSSAQGDQKSSMGSLARDCPLVENAALCSAVLRHPSIRHLQIVCSLLCTSQHMGPVLAEHCKGAVPLTLPAKQPQLAQCISWLAKNGHLVSSLNMGSVQQQAPAVADALQQAAAAAGGLQLAAFTANSPVPVAALQQLLVHLTQLTKLTVWGVQLVDSSSLPISLREVEISSCSSAAPLLPLQQLQRLAVTDKGMGAEQLQQLSSMRQLQQVELGYRDTPVNSAAAGWSAVTALISLSIWADMEDISISEAAVAQIGRCHGLTHLCMDGVLAGRSIELQATPLQLGAALGQLEKLQSLWLLNIELLPLEHVDEAAEQCSMVACMQTIARLPSLSDLGLECWLYRDDGMAAAAAAVELGAATNLTSLHLRNFDLDDYTFNSLAFCLTQLQALNVELNTELSDGIVPVIARQLGQLTALHMDRSNLTERGREGLLALKPRLQELVIYSEYSEGDDGWNAVANEGEGGPVGWSSGSESDEPDAAVDA